MPELMYFRVLQEREVEVSATNYKEALEKAEYLFDQYGNNYADSNDKTVKVNSVYISKQ